ncbi:MAG: ATP-grasp domain-containing protein, partial [Rikenellaceae bacterium]
PVSSTYKVQLGIDYSTAVSMIGDSRFIIKGIYGQKGEQVWLVDDENSYAAATNQCDKEFLIQKFIEESYGRDIRVWVVGRKAVGAVLRENKTSFKSNISAGGTARKFDLTPEISRLAVEATNAVGLEIAGVDILIGKNGYLLCEINGNAGFRSAVATAQRDVVQQMFQYLVVAKSAPFP